MRPLFAVLLLALSGPALAQDHWRIVQGSVRVLCPLTVGGSFEARGQGLKGSLSLKTAQPATFDGKIEMPLQGLDTGIGLRNEHMKDNYLEIGKGPDFATASLSAITLQGADASTVTGKTAFAGDLQVHGVTRRVQGTAEIRRSGRSIHISARFPVRLPEFGIPSPRYLGVGVRDEVQVSVTLEAAQETR
jgi:polyisoprenoid-binding protein YceI